MQSIDYSKEPREGVTTRTIEQYTARVPSLAYLGLSFTFMGVSAGLAMFTRRQSLANFVGLWVPTIMVIGVYNKLVKIEGSDRFSRRTIH